MKKDHTRNRSLKTGYNMQLLQEIDRVDQAICISEVNSESDLSHDTG